MGQNEPMHFWKGLALFSLLSLLAGCQERPILGGRTAPKTYSKIISLSPSTTEIIASFSEGDALKGRTASCNFPDFVARIMTVASTKPDYERIASIKPDLIVYDRVLYSDADIEKLKQTGAELYPFDIHTVDGLIDWVYRYASKTGNEKRFAEYVDKIYAARQAAQAKVPSPRPSVAIIIGSGPYMIAGLQTFQSDVVNLSGGQAVGPNSARFEPIDTEKLIALNPQAIFTDQPPDAILKDARLGTLEAIRRRRVARVNPDVLLRAGARVHKLIEAMSRFLQSAQG